ncbi:MAG: c-type cytochrome [Methylococcaceae bacterium]|nr:c-type cytochrome [Methylococcaceae bacterium]
MGILVMKYTLLLLALLTPLSIHAEVASDIAWTPELLKFVKNGNANNGKKLAETCASCHGDQGQGTPSLAPALAGQVASYTYKQLMDYASDQRSDAMMAVEAKKLSEQAAADLAVWFSTLPPPKASKSNAKLTRAAKMVADGDGKRILPPCFVCHGAKGQGEKMDIPALAGQQADYLAKTLLAYKNGERHNDIYSRMRLIAGQLSEAEIKELAEYYQAYQ